MRFASPQVNGVLPILPLLFPALWVLATACGEARVLAQMSKASPSSLVGVPRHLGDSRNKRGALAVLTKWAEAQAHYGPSAWGGPQHLSQGSALSGQKSLQARF